MLTFLMRSASSRFINVSIHRSKNNPLKKVFKMRVPEMKHEKLLVDVIAAQCTGINRLCKFVRKFLFLFSTGLTGCYSFWLFYYTLCGDFNLTNFYNTGEENKNILANILK